MSGDQAEFEQEVLKIVKGGLGSERVTAPQVFHRVELEGQYPDTEVVVEYSTPPNPAKATVRYAIWGPLFAGENHPESIGALIMTWATGG